MLYHALIMSKHDVIVNFREMIVRVEDEKFEKKNKKLCMWPNSIIPFGGDHMQHWKWENI